MAHAVDPDRPYRLLRQQLDRTVTGAPDSPALRKILRLLFPPGDVELAVQLPNRLTSLTDLSRKVGMAEDRLSEKISEFARRGLVIDFEHSGRRYAALAPVVIGLFEFTFMRTRGELPMAELARLFDEYGRADDRFVRSVFGGQTQIGRSLVHEEALPEGDHTEILDWERASHVVRTASAVGVSLCACRHKAEHLGKACDAPQRTCLSLNYAAETLVRNEMAERITTDEAMQILEQCKEAGLAQTGDNVQRKVAYICNCCGCCCGMIEAIRGFDIRNAIVTSNWIMHVDHNACKGCGKCVAACPVDAIEVRLPEDDETGSPRAVRDETLCLGCGVCYSACEHGAITMKPRPKRVLTPETMFDRMVMMALERGKLSELIFERPERLSHRALARLVRVIERSPLFKAAMAIRPLRSAFLRRVVAEAKKKTGEVGQLFE
jgi:ferredoxin